VSNLAGTYLVQAEEHLAAGNVKKAIDLLEHAAALGPSPAEAGRIYWNLAEAYRRLGQPDKAIQWSRRADATGFQPIRPPEKSTPSGAAKKRLVFSWKLVAIFAAGLILLAGFSWLVYRGLTGTVETNSADRPSGSVNLAEPPDAASDRSGISQPDGQEDLPALIRRITPSTVLIVTYDRQGKPLGLGTGFFVNPNGEVVTNRHVLEGASRAEIKTNQGIVYPVERVLAEDEQADLIRVSVHMPGQSVTALSMSRIVPETGQKVIVVGNPLKHHTAHRTHIARLQRQPRNQHEG